MFRLIVALIFFIFQKLNAYDTDVTLRSLFKHRDDSSTWELLTDNQSFHEVYYHEIDSRKENISLKVYDSHRLLQESIEAYHKPYEKRVRYVYNDQGLPSTVTKANGIALTYQWNARGELTALSSSDGTINQTYTYANGYLCSAMNYVTGKQTLFYLDDSTKSVEETIENGLRVGSSYNEKGQRIEFIYPDRSAIRYTYAHNHLQAIERLSSDGNQQYIHTYHTYNEWGQITSAFLIGGLGMLSFRYDDKKRCTSIESPFWRSTADFDQNNNIEAIQYVDSIGSASNQYFYDRHQQLIHESSLFEKSYGYDDKRSLIYVEGKDLVYNELYQIQDQDTQYDANGNLIRKGNYRYTYDALDRLTKIETDQERIVHQYDPFDRRVTSTTHELRDNEWQKTDLRHYIYDGCREIGCADEAGNIIELRILGKGLGEDIGAAVAMELNGKTYAPIHDRQGSITCLVDPQNAQVVETYRYSAFGERLLYDKNGMQCQKSLVGNPWGFRSKRQDRENLIFFGKRYYDPTMHYWITPDPAGTIDSHHPYLFAMNNPLSYQDFYGLYSVGEFFDDAVTWAMHTFTQVEAFVKNIDNTINPEGLSLINYIKPELYSLCGFVFKNWFLVMLGFWKEPISTASYGQNEINDKIRITSINGILNLRKDCIDTAQLISRTHGGTRVHYIHRPTEGFSRDLLNCLVVKLGHTSPAARQLAEKWKELIQEMGGTENGGKIIHYAHSIGGTDTLMAKQYMTPEELKMIEVVSFGSATIIPDKDFFSVTNYISWRDGVPYLDPSGYWHALEGNIKNTFFLDSGASLPIIDHPVSGTYADMIHELGDNFVSQNNKSSCPKIP